MRGLYVITDARLISPALFAEKVEQAILGGAAIVQYRDKSSDTARRLLQARQLKDICHRHNVISIINDDVELAQAVDADGVHLGIGDGNLSEAREKLGPGKLIGISCYNQLDRALRAQAAGADYVAFGSFFASATKPEAKRASLELLIQARQQLSVPICCIGGITVDNAQPLVSAGADMLAVITAIFGEADVKLAAQRFAQIFGPT